ncbi:MAG: hypothetical protein U0166_21625 [Acidobacteriota bacterium]
MSPPKNRALTPRLLRGTLAEASHCLVEREHLLEAGAAAIDPNGSIAAVRFWAYRARA